MDGSIPSDWQLTAPPSSLFLLLFSPSDYILISRTSTFSLAHLANHHTAATVNASPLASRKIWSRSLRPTASRPSSRTLAHRSACPARRSTPSWPRPAPPTGRRYPPTRWPSSYKQEWEDKAVFRSPLFFRRRGSFAHTFPT